ASDLKNHLEQHTTTRALFVMNDVDDWEPAERWEDLAFDIRHLRDLDKVAIVGDDLWETWLEKVELLFPMSMVQTYAAEDREEALQWLRGDMEVPGLGPGSVSDPEATAGSEE
ncbi:MAG: STAS/SEC14 domain-containing protein, partial [Bacteroidetes bacterium SW_7_64_58]